MKKIFKIQVEGRNRDRQLEASKHEVRKYVARQRRASLPEGVDYWDFACRFGLTQADAKEVHFATLIGHMDEAAQAGTSEFFVDILGINGVRKVKPEAPTPSESSTQ